MWILVILNGIGLFSGIVMNENVMYIVFAISFLAFFIGTPLFPGILYMKDGWNL